MKTGKFTNSFILSGVLLLVQSCNGKEEVTIPVVTTGEVTSITETTAQCGGTIVSDGDGEITASGVCWAYNHTPDITNFKSEDGAGSATYTSSITGLDTLAIYVVKAYATNSAGTGYGESKVFSTIGTVTDYDGNKYNGVTIDRQVWMKENLNTTHYRNGEAIPNVTLGSEWSTLETGAYCNYNNDEALAETYGKLYNFYAVVNERGLCPAGWHVPSEDEWFILFQNLDPSANKDNPFDVSETAGGKMKATGTIENGDGLWNSPNTGATNESGFTGLPGGDRSYNGPYSAIGGIGSWGSSTIDPINTNLAYFFELNMHYISIFNFYSSKKSGHSIRCLRD